MCIVKERSVPARVGVHVPLLTGYVGEKLYIDLVSMLETVRGNRYILTAEDSGIAVHTLVPTRKPEP